MMTVPVGFGILAGQGRGVTSTTQVKISSTQNERSVMNVSQPFLTVSLCPIVTKGNVKPVHS